MSSTQSSDPRLQRDIETCDDVTDADVYQPYWEVPGGKGIKDMFTRGDIDCMKGRNTYLDDYNDVARHANIIHGMVKNRRMPPGRPWPASRVQVFHAWMLDDCPRTPR